MHLNSMSYILYILVMVYTNFYANKCMFRDYSGVDQQVSGCIERNLTFKWKTLWQKEKLLVLSNFFFCHHVFKKLSAAEASESVFMREGLKIYLI